MNHSHGSLENEILSSVWAMEEIDQDVNISVSETMESINKSGNVRAYTTVKTVMDRLVEKNLLVRYKNGKKFFYKSVLSREEMSKTAIQKLAKQYFNNDMRSLMRAIERECLVLAE